MASIRKPAFGKHLLHGLFSGFVNVIARFRVIEDDADKRLKNAVVCQHDAFKVLQTLFGRPFGHSIFLRAAFDKHTLAEGEGGATALPGGRA